MLNKIDISKETKQLFDDYKNCYEIVKYDDFYALFANEKIKHSMQVVGAGNYILKNEKIFKNKSVQFLKLAKLVALFHDIGRFKEIELLYKLPQSHHNHGFYSYERLKKFGYNDCRLLLPIKQHGERTSHIILNILKMQIKSRRYAAALDVQLFKTLTNE